MPMIQKDPAEGSRATIERELKRKQRERENSRKIQDPPRSEKDDRGTEAARRRIFDSTKGLP